VRRRERGAALLLVLAAVSLLTVLAVELASRASADSLRATRSEREASFRRLFDSGGEVVRGLLVEAGPSRTTHWGQSWNQAFRFDLGPGRKAEVLAADESGKINVARAIRHPEEAEAIRGRVHRLFEYLGRTDRRGKEAWKTVRDRILQRLAVRSPLLSLDGLRETGVDAADLFGPEGLSRYLTCVGDGMINLNTAPRAVLYALDPEFDESQVERIARYRGPGDGEPGPYRPFDEPQDLMLVDGIVNRTLGADGSFKVTRNLYEKVRSLISVRSDVLSARVSATVGDRTRQAWVYYLGDGTRATFEEILP
jgi:hypothetical protein